MLTRDNSTAPSVDIYVAGFPCQPFSSAGLQRGFEDPRSNVFGGIVEYLTLHKPRTFILENVERFLTIDGGTAKDRVLDTLKNIGDPPEYKVHIKLLNTAQLGVPHNRPRVYIVGIAKAALKQEFRYPRKVAMQHIDTLLDKSIGPDFQKGSGTAEAIRAARPIQKTASKNFDEHMARIRSKGLDPYEVTHCMDVDASPIRCSTMRENIK